jgi:hypothetical protein
LDAQERQKFERGLEEGPPEVAPETVFATMSTLAGDADMIFRRGLVNMFKNLHRDYRSHDGFKIDRREQAATIIVKHRELMVNQRSQAINAGGTRRNSGSSPPRAARTLTHCLLSC